MAVAVVDVQVNSQNAVRNLQQVNAASKVAQAGVGSLKNAVAGLAASFTAISAAKFIFAKTAEIESQTRSLQVLTGSVQQAKQIIEELQQLGAVTPFTSTELIDAAKRLQAFGVQAKDVVETTRRLADASGATGAELQGLVTAYGQVQAKGRLQGEELLQFQERGIALQEELRKMYGMTGEEFQKALSKGQISAKAVEVALQRLTSAGGKYANGAIAQSDTLSGKLSTLQDGVDALARRIGQALTPALKAIFNQAIAVVDAINAALAAGRGGGFTRSVAGARQFLNVGATSQAVDRIAKGIGQITSQSNRTGIQQNLQALQQYQRLLQSVGSDDPNANRAVQLQGTILQKINENLAAQKQLQSSARQGNKLFEVPRLGAPTGGDKTKDGLKAAAALAKRNEQQIADARSLLSLTQAQFNIEGQILVARSQNNDALVTTRTAQKELATIANEIADVRANKELPDAAKLAKIAELELKAKGVSRQLAFDLATSEKEKAKNAADAMQKLLDEQALMQARLNGNEAEVLLNQQIRDLKAQYPALNEADVRTTLEKTNALKQQVDAATQLKQLYADIGSTIKTGVVEAIQGAIDGTKSLQEVANNLLSSIANKLLDVAVNFALFGAMSGTGTGGGLLGGLFKRANGGSVMAGQGYLVGERGPELFTPGRSGGIAPTGSFGGVGNVVVNVDAGGSSVQGDPGQANQLGKAIGLAVQQELIKQKRPGGLLA